MPRWGLARRATCLADGTLALHEHLDLFHTPYHIATPAPRDRAVSHNPASNTVNLIRSSIWRLLQGTLAANCQGQAPQNIIDQAFVHLRNSSPVCWAHQSCESGTAASCPANENFKFTLPGP